MERRLIELHILAAREKALKISLFCTSVYPGEWGRQISEIIIIDFQEFAFHARRINQLCGFNNFNFNDVDTLTCKLSSGDPGNWEKNYQHALNRICHIKEFSYGSAHADNRRIFRKSELNLTPLYVKISTDKFELASISIFGVVFCFLNQVIPKIKEDFPDFIF